MKHIVPAELQKKIAAGEKLQMIDVREAWEFETARIQGSILIPMGDVARRISEIDPDSEIVVICHHGGRSMQVGALLERQGFSKITNLSGGVDAWARTVDPSMPVY
jgi:rhodanese-related sulfurtransferase